MKHTFLLGTLAVFFVALPLVSHAATFTRPLYLGVKGTDVSTLQQFLTTKGYFTYPTITGYYGAFTYKAVEAYQTANNLEPVGNVGPKTRALLNVALTVTPPTTPQTTTTPPTTSTATSTPCIPGWCTLPGYAPGQLIMGGGINMTLPVISGIPPNSSVSATSPAGATVTYTAPTATDNVNTSDGVSCTPASGSTFALGVTTVTCSSTNRAGTSSTSFTVTVQDTSAPSVSLTAPSNGATVGNGSVTLTATASDSITAVSSVQFEVDTTNIGSALTSAPYTTTWNSASVSDGSHTLYAVAESTSGNYATSSISVTTDNTAPVITSIATSTVNNTNATVTWTTNEPATSIVNYGTTLSYGAASSSATLTTSHTITLAGLTASTTYDFQVQSADGVGNIATSNNKLFTTQTGLLGVNISGPEFAPWNGQKFPTSADFAYLASKGVTFVRLPIAWESVQPTLSAALNATYLGKIQSAIATAHTYGISVIVDLHNFGSYCNQAHWVSSGCGYAGNAGSTGTGVNFLGDGTLTSANFVDLWTRLSTALVGTPGLLGYDLMNEPSLKLLQYGTNLLFAPNGFGDTIGSQPWYTINSGVVSQLAAGTNPIAGYGPAWSITSGTGYGGVFQSAPYTNAAYVLSCYAKVSSGTDTLSLEIDGNGDSGHTVTTSWQRFSTTTIATAGSANTGVDVSDGTAGHTIQIADCQLQTGSSPTAYVPNVYIPYAQAAITAIRGVDASTPIYVNGFDNGTAYLWPWENWEMSTLTGGNLVFEAHQYFDGSVAQAGGGGTYSGNYSSYSITSTAGVQEVAPFESWLASTAVSGYVGEYAIPDNSKSDQSSWLTLQNNFLQNLIANNIPSTMWFYGSPGLQPSNILNIATSTTANSGSDDVRLTQMLLQY